MISDINYSGSSPSLALEDIYPQLKPCIISHSRALRLGALRLLASGFVQTRHEQKDVLKRCLQGEEVSLDLQGVRERVLRIGRIGQVVKDDDGLLADICIRWLTSMSIHHQTFVLDLTFTLPPRSIEGQSSPTVVSCCRCFIQSR